MHIPDGLLRPELVAGLGAVSVAGVAVAARRAGRELEEKSVPLVGVMGAFVFALQMLNFPLAAGVSDHIVGGALLAIVMGPSVAVLAMAAILVIQAFVFADGGVAALGANVFNMAIVSVLSAWLLHRFLKSRLGSAAVLVATFVAVLLGSAAAALEIIASQPYGLKFFGLMAGTHAVSGAVEAVVTLAVVKALATSKVGVLQRQEVANV